MQTPDDVKIVRFTIRGSVRVDLDRAKDDPIWNSLTAMTPPENDEELNEAVVAYVKHYLSEEEMLTNMPSTCGPADFYETSGYVHDRRKKNLNACSNAIANS